jgi:hypothetical protein
VATDALVDGVVNTLQADATLASAAPSGVWRHIAPEGMTGVYVVVTPQINMASYEMGGEVYEVQRVQVKAVHESTTGASAQTAADRVDVLLNQVTLTISGFTCMTCHRVETFEYVERTPTSVYQHRGSDYELWADPN